MIGDAVDLRIEAEAVRDRNAADPADTPPVDATGTPVPRDDSQVPSPPPVEETTP